tara:strand:- start:400 stop:948 length:549 start_codon:yes stop_codon:yes gene_type:complete
VRIIQDIFHARQLIKSGHIIAYPTEAVYGLGCDPFNAEAVEKLIALKSRDILKGLIILVSSWQQFQQLTKPLTAKQTQQIRSTWPGHVTWIVPKSKDVPLYLTGQRESIAIRMSAHPIASALCRNTPIISTSANLSGQPPAMSVDELIAQFPSGLDGVVEGELGGAQKPSQIFDVTTGLKIR